MVSADDGCSGMALFSGPVAAVLNNGSVLAEFCSTSDE